MRYWWVNQNQTFRQEIAGGYLWSPKRNANGGRNPFYESMREVAPGDLIFSFVDTRITAIGIAKSYCWECPKPTEFGSTGQNWENIGWRVNVSFVSLLNKVRPKDHMDALKAVLPQRYSPLQANGKRLRQWLCAKHRVLWPGTNRFPAGTLHEVLGLVRLTKRTRNLPWATS
jgi:putative restriction endonuclease